MHLSPLRLFLVLLNAIYGQSITKTAVDKLDNVAYKSYTYMRCLYIFAQFQHISFSKV